MGPARRVLAVILSRWKEKTISLLLALGLWFYVENLKIGTISLNVPVIYRGKPDGLEFSQEPPRFIEVKIRGDKERLNFPTTRLRAEVDLKGASADRTLYPVTIDEKLFPENVEIVDPAAHMSIRFEKSVMRFISLRPVVTGTPKDGFKRGRVVVIPDRIRIQAGQERLQAINEIALPPVDISGASQTLTRVVPIRAPAGTAIPGAAEAEVTVVIVPMEHEAEKTLEVPLSFRNPSPGIVPSTQVHHVRITVHGESGSIKDLEESDVDAYLDLAGLDVSGDTESLVFEIPVRILLKKPGKNSVVSSDPDTVSVRFERKK